MNIILEGPDGIGKTTLANKLVTNYNMNYNHFPSETLENHLNALYQGNTVFDRFHIGELVYPEIYGREPKFDFNGGNKIMRAIVDNNDLLIIFITSDINILKDRLIQREEYNYLEEIEQQNQLFTKYAYIFSAWEYSNMYVVDIALEGAYDRLWSWIVSRMNQTNINIAYKNVCRDLIEKGELISGGKTTRGDYRELSNYSFTIDDITNDVINLKSRNISYNYLIGEMLWYWSGRNDLAFIRHFSKFWDKISDDGVTSNSAYGYVLQKKHGFNQIETIIDLLKQDPSSRRAILNFNTPNVNVKDTKDEICTICLSFMIRDNKLNCTTVMRSNDVIFGLSYDLSFFISLQKYIADRLGVSYGSYTHYAFSMHVYEKDFDLVSDIAYGDMRILDNKLDIYRLIKSENIMDKLIDYVDNKWTSKEDFIEVVKDCGIIR